MNEPKDNLEDFFRQSFDDAETVNQAGEWNMPSDAVWEGIKEGMTEERRLSFAFLKWPWSAIAASYLLLVGGYQFIEKYTKQTDLASAVVVEELMVENEVLTDDMPSADEFIRQTMNKQVVALVKPINQTKNLPVLAYMEGDKLYSESLDLLDFSKSAHRHSGGSDLSLFAKKNKIDNIDNQLITKKEEVLKLQNRETLDNLTSIGIQNVVSLNAKSPTINVPPITTPTKKQSNLYIATNYSTISEDFKPYNLSAEPADQLVANTKVSKGRSVGIDLGWTNKKGWAIETGIHFSKQEKETVVNRVIPAQLLQANVNTDGTSKVDLAWNDTHGENGVGLAVNNPSDIKTALSLQLTQNTQHRFIEVLFLVRKNWRIGKLNLSVKTGLLNRFNSSNTYEEPSIVDENDQFQVVANELKRNTSIEPKKYVPQLIAGFGLEYFIQPNLSVYVEPSFSKSIRPIIDFGFANIHSQNKAVTMGMRYHL